MSGLLHAYVDETGTNELDTSKTGVSAFFICVAVVVESERVEELTDGLDKIAEQLCGGAEIKSSSMGRKHTRRRQFLNAIADLDFGYYAMLIRKDAVWKESGLQYKRSFYKCINKMLYRRLTRGSRSIRIFADQIGGQDFMKSFGDYLERELKPDLFFTYEHQFVDSKKNRMIQLADLIAGTLAQCYEPEKRGEHSEAFREFLKRKELAIDSWPTDNQTTVEVGREVGQADELRTLLMARAQRFIHEYETSGDNVRLMQIVVLRSLIFAREFEKPAQQIISREHLIQQLNDQGFEVSSKQAFTKDIIGGIRMEGVILAGTRHGYRLALTKADISDYLDHNKSIIEPMLARLREARKAVKLDTVNRIDIVADGPYQTLSRLLDCTEGICLVLDELETF